MITLFIAFLAFLMVSQVPLEVAATAYFRGIYGVRVYPKMKGRLTIVSTAFSHIS